MVDDASRSSDDAGDPHTARPLKLALELVSAGYFVAPVVIRRDPRTGKKVGDYLRIRWHDQSTLEPAQVRDWWAQYQCSYLIDTGRSGVFAVASTSGGRPACRGCPERWTTCALCASAPRAAACTCGSARPPVSR
jgi:hypothetical protein